MAKNRRGGVNIWIITIVALAWAMLIGYDVYLMATETPVTMFKFAYVTMNIGGCIVMLVISRMFRTILKMEDQGFEPKERIKDLTVINGFSIGAITKIIAFTLMVVYTKMLEFREYAAGKKFDTGHDLTAEEAEIKIPEDIQENLELIWVWLGARRFYNSWEELYEHLKHAVQRVEYLRELQK